MERGVLFKAWAKAFARRINSNSDQPLAAANDKKKKQKLD
jgi:hypothetical protein